MTATEIAPIRNDWNMVVRIPPPVVFALFLAAGLLLNLDHMRRDREADHRRQVVAMEETTLSE